MDAYGPGPSDLDRHQPTLGPQRSPKSYATAVVLSGVLGGIGAQHFYLGRPVTGIVDAGLGFVGIALIVLDQLWLGLAMIAADVVHSLVVTIQLLTGCYRDGRGRIVCYPGQKLAGHDSLGGARSDPSAPIA